MNTCYEKHVGGSLNVTNRTQINSLYIMNMHCNTDLLERDVLESRMVVHGKYHGEASNLTTIS
jgi:hypothetical protein